MAYVWKGTLDRGRLVPFSVFNMKLMTSLPATERRVEFDSEEASIDLGRIV